MVTGPVNKGAIAKTGIPFTGHTDELTRFIKDEMALDKNPVMLMYAEKIRMLLLTTHIPISQVEKRLDILTSLEAIISAVKFLEMEHEKKRKIAILGIDPHSGDQGAIGNLDQEFTIPLIEKLKEENIQADGPISSDSFFAGEEYLKYGLIVSAYHDQGMIPFKIHCFGKGVNVTLNLPVKRTSPDHGTAYHLAGKKKADAGSMVKAIQLCLKWIQFEYDN
jgi:4-hydroxythreonine-4-phosphate dehydrogenase